MSLSTFKHYKPRFRKVENHKTDRFTVPMGFNSAVMEYLKPMKVSRSYITMVRKGKRKSDFVMDAIIEVAYNWDKIENERLRKLL